MNPTEYKEECDAYTIATVLGVLVAILSVSLYPAINSPMIGSPEARSNQR